LRPFPKLTKRYKDPRKEHVEDYVATVIPRDVRNRLQALLDSQSDLDLEQTVAKLIDLGLDQAEQDHGALKPNPAEVFEGATNTTKVAASSMAADLAFSMEGRLRHKLQAFIDAHPDVIPRDEALHMLLVLGLDRARDRTYADFVEDTASRSLRTTRNGTLSMTGYARCRALSEARR